MTPSPAPGGTGSRDPLQGPLSRGAAHVYRYLVLGVLVSAGTLPTLVLLHLLDRSPGSALLLPLCLLPAVPAWSAAVFALHRRDDDGSPARAFWRGLRLNTADVLVLWAPALAVQGIVAMSVVHADAAGIGAGYAVVLLVVGAALGLWALEALVLASVLSFRRRDVARLATFYLARRPGVTVGLLALLVVAAGLVWSVGAVTAALVAVVWLAFLERVARPVLADATENFTT